MGWVVAGQFALILILIGALIQSGQPPTPK